MNERYEYHTPVLLDEVLNMLVGKPDGVYLDGTMGGGGHFRAMAQKLDPGALLIGIDRDPEAVLFNKERFAAGGPSVVLEQSRFSEFDTVLRNHAVEGLDGILLDLGVSSRQIDVQERGFSYMKSAPLDMRMDLTTGMPAWELIERSDETALAGILREYGEVEGPMKIVRAVKQWGGTKSPMRTAADLRECCAALFGGRVSINLLARIFQALRIAVNDELGELRRFLSKTPGFLRPGGRLAIISYHSLEDRMVKEFIRLHERTCSCPPELPRCVCSTAPLFKRLTKKAVRPSSHEADANPRARSARLRVAERTRAAR